MTTTQGTETIEYGLMIDWEDDQPPARVEVVVFVPQG